MDDEISLALIRLWCEVTEDANPMYHDAAFAARSRHGSIIAPPQMIMPLTSRPEWTPAGPVRGMQAQLANSMPEYPHAASLEMIQHFKRPLRVGERPTIYKYEAEPTAEVMTERGPGRIIEQYFSFRDDRGDEICGYRMDQLRYRSLDGQQPSPPPVPNTAAPDVLVPLTLPITLKRCIKWVAATRDFYEVHHDRDYAKSVGEPDLFIGVHFAHALMGRYATDWGGPASDIRRFAFKAHGRVILGENLTVQGRVARRYDEAGEQLVDLALEGFTERMLTHTCTVTLALGG